MRPQDTERTEWWVRRLVTFMQEGMDPGLIAAVLFYHWLETLYMDDLIDRELDPDAIQSLADRLYAALTRSSNVRVAPIRTSEPSAPPVPAVSDDRWTAGQQTLGEHIRRMFPRRILHQRDIRRFTMRLSDELDNTMVEVAQWDGHLHRWRPIVFALWWWLKTCLTLPGTSPEPVPWARCLALEHTARHLVIIWLQKDTPSEDPAPGT